MSLADHELDEQTDVTQCSIHECDRPCVECFSTALDRQHDTRKEQEDAL